MKKLFRAATLSLIVAAGFQLAQAEPTYFAAVLNSAQEVVLPPGADPPENLPGIGFGSVVLNESETQALVSVSFSGLTSNQILAHIHGPAAPGSVAGVLFNIGATNQLEGSFNNLVWNLSPTQVGFLKSGLLYFNVHTVNFPGGEIRGQIQAVPEPASLILLASGLLAAGAVRRRRRKS